MNTNENVIQLSHAFLGYLMFNCYMYLIRLLIFKVNTSNAIVKCVVVYLLPTK